MPGNDDERAYLLNQIEAEIEDDLGELDIQAEYTNVYLPTKQQLITRKNQFRAIRLELSREHLERLRIDELRILLAEAGFLDDDVDPEVTQRFLQFYNPLSPNYAHSISDHPRENISSGKVPPRLVWRSARKNFTANPAANVDGNSSVTTNQSADREAEGGTRTAHALKSAEPIGHAMRQGPSTAPEAINPDNRDAPSHGVGNTVSAKKMPPVSIADLEAWWDRRTQIPEYRNFTIRQDWDAASAEFPGKMVSRERVVALRGRRKRGPKGLSR